jgi:hypothetical protein
MFANGNFTIIRSLTFVLMVSGLQQHCPIAIPHKTFTYTVFKNTILHPSDHKRD